jgi:ribosomal protein L37AE/L43A
MEDISATDYDLCECSICHTKILWGGKDDNKGIIWSCEKCGEYFCQQCFIDRFDGDTYYSMVLDDAADNETPCENAILCPDCRSKAIRSAATYIKGTRRLTAEDIAFERDSLMWMNDVMSFYIPTTFNADEVFGTNIETSNNTDTLNVYASYDSASRELSDYLELILYKAKDVGELRYTLDNAEKTMLIHKINEYCKEEFDMDLSLYLKFNEVEQKCIL